MHSTRWLSVIALVGVVLLHAGRAWAPFHVMAVDEVFFGTADCPNAQYVGCAAGPGMTLVNTQHVTTQTADGSAAADWRFDKTPRTAPTAHILMGTADAAGLFAIAMDIEVSGQLVPTAAFASAISAASRSTASPTAISPATTAAAARRRPRRCSAWRCRA
jgi:hypothetical protein